jgi:hypothetical protein
VHIPFALYSSALIRDADKSGNSVNIGLTRKPLIFDKDGENGNQPAWPDARNCRYKTVDSIANHGEAD